MGTLKPNTLILQSLTAFFKDVGNQFQVSQRNIKLSTEYVLRRTKCEGFTFITKVLPKVGKALDASLRDGKLHPMPVKTSRRGGHPLIFKGIVHLVFDTDGTLLDTPDADAIKYMRQLCFMFYKLEGEYPKELVDECIANFVSVDETLSHCDEITPEKTSVLYEASKVIGEIFSDFDPEDITPRPGPGQTADKCSHEYRYEPHVLYKELHEAYPYYRYFYCNTRHLTDSVHSYRALPRRQDGCSVLAVVPKDSRGPRIICMEPSEYMWLQQGLGRAMMSHIESHRYTRGHVNFTDQTVNGKLAREASLSGLHATLDMKEASDRISKSLIDYLFQEVPRLRRRLLALSTGRTQLPDGRIIVTKKFAPMGSALCFPVMSVVHYALAIACLKHARPGVSVMALAKDLYVYGDDIICHVRDVETLLEEFPVYGLMFNRDKSFFTGNFRESCGVDAYAGVDVTPQRIKSIRFSKKDGNLLQKHLAYYHGFKSRNMHESARVWRAWIEETYGDLPYVTEGSGVPGWLTPRDRVHTDNVGWKWDRKLQTWVKRVRVCKTPPHASMSNCWEHLLRAQVHCVEGESTTLAERRRTKLVWKTKPIQSL